jgi:hypothetical protein
MARKLNTLKTARNGIAPKRLDVLATPPASKRILTNADAQLASDTILYFGDGWYAPSAKAATRNEWHYVSDGYTVSGDGRAHLQTVARKAKLVPEKLRYIQYSEARRMFAAIIKAW